MTKLPLIALSLLCLSMNGHGGGFCSWYDYPLDVSDHYYSCIAGRDNPWGVCK